MESSVILILVGIGCQVVVVVVSIVFSQINALRARRATEDVATALTHSASVQKNALDHIASVGDATHVLVNNRTSVMLRVIASLARKVSDDNPNDVAARRLAEQAEADVTADEKMTHGGGG